jgi:hypothetical protein
MKNFRECWILVLNFWTVIGLFNNRYGKKLRNDTDKLLYKFYSIKMFKMYFKLKYIF